MMHFSMPSLAIVVVLICGACQSPFRVVLAPSDVQGYAPVGDLVVDLRRDLPDMVISVSGESQAAFQSGYADLAVVPPLSLVELYQAGERFDVLWPTSHLITGRSLVCQRNGNDQSLVWNPNFHDDADRQFALMFMKDQSNFAKPELELTKDEATCEIQRQCGDQVAGVDCVNLHQVAQLGILHVAIMEPGERQRDEASRFFRVWRRLIEPLQRLSDDGAHAVMLTGIKLQTPEEMLGLMNLVSPPRQQQFVTMVSQVAILKKLSLEGEAILDWLDPSFLADLDWPSLEETP